MARLLRLSCGKDAPDECKQRNWNGDASLATQFWRVEKSTRVQALCRVPQRVAQKMKRNCTRKAMRLLGEGLNAGELSQTFSV